jgi:hypothetical protein
MTVDDTENPVEPRWLLWAREMQALAQTGLAFTRDQYDRERYQRLRALAAEITSEHVGMAMPDIEVMFAQQSGYATPKLGVRGAVFAMTGYCWFVRRQTKVDAAWRLGRCEREPCRGRRQGGARGGRDRGASL